MKCRVCKKEIRLGARVIEIRNGYFKMVNGEEMFRIKQNIYLCDNCADTIANILVY